MNKVDNKQRTRSESKWAKYQILKSLPDLAPYLPATQRFTRRNLWQFIAKYGTVMLKPTLGHSGYGIIQVSRLEKYRYALQKEDRKIILDGKQAVYEQIDKMILDQSYLVQQRIPLAQIEKRPFDIRVVVSRANKDTARKIKGMFAKVAEEGYVITNVASQVIPVKQAIESSNLKPDSIQKLIRKIELVCLVAARYLCSFYPSQNMIGLDIGLDRDAQVWIIEANFKPSMKPFLLLKRRSEPQKLGKPC
ncbi:YheC/YheD family protein [Paenibacillus sp. FSL W8-0186]|uniref:YheC/YheD family protein n=1 Tax=Paenibacillus sp. FSL W8-0186 TaxID=2921709 RepID=UPI0030CE39E3